MIEIKNLEFFQGKKKILDGVSLTVPHKKFTGIIGPNGAGKSTLLKNIYGIYEFSKGDIFIDGVSVKKMSGKEKAVWTMIRPEKLRFLLKKRNISLISLWKR